jgi:hypothetical protein
VRLARTAPEGVSTPGTSTERLIERTAPSEARFILRATEMTSRPETKGGLKSSAKREARALARTSNKQARTVRQRDGRRRCAAAGDGARRRGRWCGREQRRRTLDDVETVQVPTFGHGARRVRHGAQQLGPDHLLVDLRLLTLRVALRKRGAIRRISG